MATNILLLLLVLLAISVPVAAAIGVLSLFVAEVYSPMPLVRAIAENLWQTGREFILIAIPMFILLGEILLRSGIAQRMYDAMAKWLSWLPGGLMHSNIGACAMFSATSGSSVATAATVSTVALPEVDKRGYNERLFLGTLAAGGTLGILIPPSINLIVYGLLTDTSVPDLYLAGFLPGFLLASLFMVTMRTPITPPPISARRCLAASTCTLEPTEIMGVVDRFRACCQATLNTYSVLPAPAGAM